MNLLNVGTAFWDSIYRRTCSLTRSGMRRSPTSYAQMPAGLGSADALTGRYPRSIASTTSSCPRSFKSVRKYPQVAKARIAIRLRRKPRRRISKRLERVSARRLTRNTHVSSAAVTITARGWQKQSSPSFGKLAIGHGRILSYASDFTPRSKYWSCSWSAGSSTHVVMTRPRTWGLPATSARDEVSLSLERTEGVNVTASPNERWTGCRFGRG